MTLDLPRGGRRPGSAPAGEPWHSSPYTPRSSWRSHILREIRRTAVANGGRPLGAERFTAETGIGQMQWRGQYWARWGDALREAGFEPNEPNRPFGQEELIERSIDLVRQLGRLPTWAEQRLAKRQDPTFPGESAYRRAGLGTTEALASRIVDYCEQHKGFEDVLAICTQGASARLRGGADTADREGSVYLIKSGRHYKIGCAYEFGRRVREIALQLPERAVTVHVIKTDDPIGIEAYWHKRFEAKRKGGEWFDLTDADVRAFRRRRTFM